MAASYATLQTNDQPGLRRDLFSATVFTAGTLNGSTEHIVGLPYSDREGDGAGNGWELIAVVLSAGVNTTHTDTVPQITATVEKNTDGGTSALATAPVIANTAGTGRRTTGAAATGITQAVMSATEANKRFADNDTAFVTITETGGSGTDPSDVSCTLTFARLQNWDPLA